MRDGSVSSKPGLIAGATTNELVPYLPSVVALQRLLRGDSENVHIIFEGIDGRGQRYHAKFMLWLVYDTQHQPQYILAMSNPNALIHFPNETPPYRATTTTTTPRTRTTSNTNISLASSSSSSSNETSPNQMFS